MKKSLFVLIAGLLIVSMLAACAPQAAPVEEAPAEEAPVEEAAAEEAAPAEVPFNEKGYKLAYLMNGGASDIFKMSFDASQAEAAKLGMTMDILMTGEQDDVAFQDLVNQAIQGDYDGLFISHGKSDYSYDMIKRAVDAGKQVVTFDTVIEGPDGEGVPGVTTMFQSDQEMAKLSLDYIVNVLFPDTRPVKVLKLWVGPGIPPFDRRQEMYVTYEEQGLIETLEVLGWTDTANIEGSLNTVVASVLPRYPEGSVDVIWSAYDAMGRGAYKALYEAGRKDIKLVSIDISNVDINLMREPDSVWEACVAVHFENVGIQGVRLLAMKLHGDETPAEFYLKPSLVPADQLTPDATVLNLQNFVDGYGVFPDNWEPWMEELQ
jgi:simple sugar transport system substrate-binding protein